MAENIWNTLQISVDWVMRHLTVINMILAVVIIFFQRRKPQIVWTWLLVLYFLPIVGFVLYLLIGQDFRKNRMFKLKGIEEELRLEVRRQEKRIERKGLKLENEKMERFENLIYYNLQEANAVLTGDNDVRIYADGREKFRSLVQEIRLAENYIHLQYYIIRNDELWQSIEKELIKKAEQGVEVRVLFDAMGCRKMRKKDWKPLKDAGVEVAEFFPAIFGNLQLRVNYRNHRKIAVIDGRVGFVGGFNIGREYIGLDKKFGYWRDTHLRIEGEAASYLAVRFALDWNYAAKTNLFLRENLFEVSGYIHRGNTPVQIISSGPDSKRAVIRDNYMRLIHKARHHIYIQTPYFIPDDCVLEALKIAAKSGIDVRIMIPCKPDHPFVYWATYSYVGEMIDAGAKCYVYNNGFLHVKGIVVDGLVSCFGTANMDVRSFELNFEVNAVIYSEETSAEMEEIFERDIAQSTLLTKRIYESRSLVIRVKEQFSRLLSPLL